MEGGYKGGDVTYHWRELYVQSNVAREEVGRASDWGDKTEC
jgi:hypothetical protein